MSRFTVQTIQRTPNTQQHRILFNGQLMAICMKHENAEKIATYFEDNNVVSLKAWKALPGSVRRSFAMSTDNDSPMLPMA